jgi:penicillin amidase
MNIGQTLRGFGSFRQLAAALLLSSRPEARSVEQRLKAIPLTGAPLEHPVTIHWNNRHVPMISAQTDYDCAVALGVVHAHLRLGQIEMMRRIARGRVSEMVGPAAIELDHALQALDFTRDMAAAIAGMSDPTRAWLKAFVAGINHVLRNITELPPEFGWLGMEREDWTIEDIVSIGRLSGADVHWMIWLKMLPYRDSPEWPGVWRRMMEMGLGGMASGGMSGGGIGLNTLGQIIGGAKSGSNSLAVGGKASGTGAAMIASDPHLPITMPNVWLMAGFKCPSYDVVGLMLPALPFVALGRNRHIAWGGTNLHAASSDFVDISAETEFTTRDITIRVRGGRDVKRTVSDSRYGPVLSDAPLLKRGSAPFALRWAGHQRSREFDAMLAFNRASNWAEFAADADGFAVPGQNFTYADREGHVGKLIAALLPRRHIGPTERLLTTEAEADTWSNLAVSRDLPREYDPERGFVASANDPPPKSDFPIGFFYSSKDRVERITQILSRPHRITFDILARLQRDVSLAPALPFRDMLLEIYDGATVDRDRKRFSRPVVAALRLWDGSYDADSAGALAFETVVTLIFDSLHSNAEKAAYSSVWHMRELTQKSLETAPHARAARIVSRAIEHAVPIFQKHRTWGEVHRLRLRHPISVLPVLGKRMKFMEWGAGGNDSTVMKTGARGGTGPHSVPYGSCARHISDLSDVDANYFCLLGGQDGWMGSDTMLDQVADWQGGRYLRLPLQDDTIAEEFPLLTVLTPDA